MSFYAQAFKGQYQIITRDKPVEALLAASNTLPELKARLELLQELRTFAGECLKLPVNGHYRKYVDLGRPFAVWNVEAAGEFSLEPKTWWYPIVGSLKYRGYFTEHGATNYAAHLRQKGLDVTAEGVQAYSTLGWFKDPALNTFIFESDADLAELLFHELAHQKLFAHGDTDFNEAFATTVGQEGARRWLKARRDPAVFERYLEGLRRNAEFVSLVSQTRRELEELYGDVRTEAGEVKAAAERRGVTEGQLREGKRRAIEDLRARYGQLKIRWDGYSGYDEWFRREINNAKLNSVATYYDLVPGFEGLLREEAGNLEQFYAAAGRLAKASRKDRHERLRILAQPGEGRL
jgi:predicted aminopeptidase